MKLLTYRRVRNTGLMLVALILLWLWCRTQHSALRSTTFATGYLLMASIAILAMYNVRKKLPSLPLGSSTTWLQWHLYIGIATIGITTLSTTPP